MIERHVPCGINNDAAQAEDRERVPFGVHHMRSALIEEEEILGTRSEMPLVDRPGQRAARIDPGVRFSAEIGDHVPCRLDLVIERRRIIVQPRLRAPGKFEEGEVVLRVGKLLPCRPGMK